jgi:hypothetical protein
MKKLGIVFGALFIIASIMSCKKDRENATYRVYLTDQPGEYQHVYVDIQEIRIHTNNGGWMSPTNFNPGIYDLLEFNNGMDTLLCSFELPAGKVTQIRLVLGSNNSVVINGISHPLTTPSGQTSGLKLNVHHEIVAGNSYQVWLDFDASKSVVANGNGGYLLKPVIRVFTDLTNGKIKGYVTPMLALPVVHAIQGQDTVSAIPNSDGFFMICGLSGSYNVVVEPSVATFMNVSINNVQVQYGLITDLGVITIP